MTESSCPCDGFTFPEPLSIASGLGGDELRSTRALGLFGDFRRAILQSIAVDPRLDSWRARDVDDFGMMLVDFAAVIFDGIAFYDALASGESYLGTARMEGAQRRLVGLLGYRPRPAVASEVWLTVQVDGPKLAQVEPGWAVRSAGFDAFVDGSDGPLKMPPQVFEVHDRAVLEPRLNALVVGFVPEGAAPSSLTELLAEPGSVAVRAGDAVVVRVGTDPAAALYAAVRVASIQTGVRNGESTVTKITLAAAVSNGSGAAWRDIQIFSGGAAAGLWKHTVPAGEAATIQSNSVLLESRVPILPGDVLLLERGASLAARRVTSATEELHTLYAPGATTLTSDSETTTFTPPAVKVALTRVNLPDFPYPSAAASAVVVRHALGRAAALVAPLKATLAQGNSAVLPGLGEPPRVSVGRVALEDAHGEGLVAEAHIDAGLRSASFSGTPAWSVAGGSTLAAPVRLHGNVVRATRGESVHDELLGSGDAGLTTQSWKLAKKPLTYVPDDSEAGFSSTLRVRIDGVLWAEVPTFYGVEPAARVYVVKHDDDGETHVVVGGGARVPTGARVTASYRFGAGAASPPAGAVNQLATPNPVVKSVRNVTPASGGADRESPESLAASAPKSALLLDRAVSLDDLETLTAQSPDVLSARVTWHWDPEGLRPAARLVYITSAPDGLASDFERRLLSRLRSAAEDDVPIAVVRAARTHARIDLSVRVEPRFSASSRADAIREVLLGRDPSPTAGRSGLLRPERLGPDGTVFQSQVVAAVMGVDGVVAIDSLSLDGTAFVEFARTPPSGGYFDFTSAKTSAASGVYVTVIGATS